MTRAAWTVIVCLLGAIAELALLLAAVPPGDEFASTGLAFLTFLVGPLVFLAVVAWRRRTHPGRSRWLFTLANVVASLGLIALAIHFRTDAETRKHPLLNPAFVPLVQWVIVLFAWLRLSAFERIEQRRGT